MLQLRDDIIPTKLFIQAMNIRVSHRCYSTGSSPAPCCRADKKRYICDAHAGPQSTWARASRHGSRPCAPSPSPSAAAFASSSGHNDRTADGLSSVATAPAVPVEGYWCHDVAAPSMGNPQRARLSRIIDEYAVIWIAFHSERIDEPVPHVIDELSICDQCCIIPVSLMRSPLFSGGKPHHHRPQPNRQPHHWSIQQLQQPFHIFFEDRSSCSESSCHTTSRS